MELKPGYKKTEVGVIPEDWKVIDLSNLCTLQRGFDLTEATKKTGTIPVYTSSGQSYFHNKAIVFPPGIVTGRKGILGKVFLINEPFWPHDTTLWVKDFKGNSPEFVKLVLENFHLERLDAATSVPTLNRNNLVGHLVAIPPTKSEQTAIATVLSDMDSYIESLAALITKKRLIKQGAMQELLTGKRRLPGFQQKPGYKQTEVGVIPEEWEAKPLEKLGTFKNGINKNSESFGKGFPYVSLTDVFNSTSIHSSVNLKLVETNEFEQQTYSLKKGDILFVRSSVKTSGVGLTVVIEKNLPKTVFSGFLIRFRVLGSFFLDFKKYCFLEENFRKRVIGICSFSANTNINQDNLGKLIVVYPSSKSEQTAIATVLSDMDSEIETLESKLSKARDLKQGMMQELLTGRIRLV